MTLYSRRPTNNIECHLCQSSPPPPCTKFAIQNGDYDTRGKCAQTGFSRVDEIGEAAARYTHTHTLARARSHMVFDGSSVRSTYTIHSSYSVKC